MALSPIPPLPPHIKVKPAMHILAPQHSAHRSWISVYAVLEEIAIGFLKCKIQHLQGYFKKTVEKMELIKSMFFF